MREWLNKLLSDSSGVVSSKRFITFAAFILCGIQFLTELYTGQKVGEHTLDSMMYIVIAGLGFTASEKFSKKE